MSRDLLIENPLWVHDRKRQHWLDPTPADIAAWLSAHPKEAVEIVRGLKVAGEWREHHTGRWFRASANNANGDTLRHATDVYPEHDDVTDEWMDAAKAAADAALVAAGWSLADGGGGG